MAAISVHWSGLVQVAEVSLGFGVGIVVVFTLGVLGAARLAAARTGDHNARGAGAVLGGYLQAGLAFASCAAATGYGLYLLVPQFHS